MDLLSSSEPVKTFSSTEGCGCKRPADFAESQNGNDIKRVHRDLETFEADPAYLLAQLASVVSKASSFPSTGLTVLLSGIESLSENNGLTRATPSLQNSCFSVQMLLNPKQELGSQSSTSPECTSNSLSPFSSGGPSSPEGGQTSPCDDLSTCSAPVDSFSNQLDSHFNAANETVVSMYHASVAQKSYGNEKRFLCPPPVIQISGVLRASHKPMLRMGIFLEEGSRGVEHKALLDEYGRSCFKYLHVTDTLKSKRFHLKLKTSISNESSSLSFDSKPITIISKPSKKTYKARNNTLAIMSGSMVCLFNRVNSQTVRTKYLTVESNRLCAKNSSWTAFEILALNDSKTIKASGIPINYGMNIILRNVETGTYSDILVVKKVSKDSICHDSQGPVSQMQKIALELASQPGLYLSIIRTSAFSSNLSNQFLCYRQQPENSDELDNHMSWTVVGVEKTQYRYMDNSFTATTCDSSTQPHLTDFRADSVLTISGKNLDCIKCISLGPFSVPLISRSADTLTANIPQFSNDDEFLSAAQQTSFGYSLTIPVILIRDDGLSYHTGRFIIFERVSDGNITRRFVEV